MTDRNPEARNSTGAQLKADINAGRTGDKVPAFDPAAAPLGTDEEAAGTPTPPEAWAAARRQEVGRAPATQGPPAPWIVGLSGVAVDAAAIGWLIVELT
jgi:hypothetical protein